MMKPTFRSPPGQKGATAATNVSTMGAIGGLAAGIVDALHAMSSGSTLLPRQFVSLGIASVCYAVLGALVGALVLPAASAIWHALARGGPDAHSPLRFSSLKGREWSAIRLLEVLLAGIPAVLVGWGIHYLWQLAGPPTRFLAFSLETFAAICTLLLYLHVVSRLRGALKAATLSSLTLLSAGVLAGLLRGLPDDIRPAHFTTMLTASRLEVPKGRPNVVLIVLDTTRADRLSLYGYPKETSPFLRSLEKDSTVYDLAISPAPWTLPAHASLFTGLPPTQHGATRLHRYLDGGFPTLAERLLEAGFETVSLSSNSWVSPSFNLTRGFQEHYAIYERIHLAQNDPLPRLSLHRLLDILPLPPPLRDKGASSLNRHARSWLNQHEAQSPEVPFFMFVNLMEAHLPYNAPRTYQDQYLSSALRPALQFLREDPWWLEDHSNELLRLAPGLSTEDRQQLGELYDACLAYQDDQLKQLLTSIGQTVGLENTIVVITADHGENLGEHDGLLSHIFSLHQSVLHVPLLIRYPAAFERGLRISTLVGSHQVRATLLKTLGLDLDEGAPPLPMSAQEAGMETVLSFDDPPVDELAMLVMHAPGTDVRSRAVSRWALQDGRFKVTRTSDDITQAVDLASDPLELAPLSEAESVASKHLEGALLEEEREWIGRTHAQKFESASATADKATLEALRALGYVH